VRALIGSDSYLAEEALEKVLTEVVGSEREEAVRVFRGEESNWAQVLDALRTPSLFARLTAVVVRRAEALKGAEEEILAYLEDPSPRATLVLLAGKPDRRRVLWKKVADKGLVTSVEPLKGRALRSHVLNLLRSRALKIDEEGVEELLERVGQDLRRLVGEIDKLESFAQNKTLNGEDVAAVLGRGMARPLYRLSDALAARQASTVVRLMWEILEEEAPLRILATLHRTLRQLIGARAMAKAPRAEVATRLGVMPFRVGELLEAARRWSDEELRCALVALGKADRTLKLGADPRAALTGAVNEICRGGSASSVTRHRPSA